MPCSSRGGMGVTKVFTPYKTSQITPARQIMPMSSHRTLMARAIIEGLRGVVQG